jgi:hypothetical protein
MGQLLEEVEITGFNLQRPGLKKAILPCTSWMTLGELFHISNFSFFHS